MNNMFGVTYNNNRQYEFFSWRNFKSNELILRVLPNYFSTYNKLYDKIYTHQINGKFYVHPTDGTCPLCEVLNSDDKYSEIQDKLVKAKINDKKEKWNHIINNHMYVMLFAIIKGYSKIQIIRFYDTIGESLMNIILGKDIKENITDLRKGNSIKIMFNQLQYFPYIQVNDIIIGKEKPIFPDEEKIVKLDNILHTDEFKFNKNVLSLDKSQEIIDIWYDKAVKFYNMNTHSGNKEKIIDNNFMNDDELAVDENDTLNDSKDNDTFDFDNDSDEDDTVESDEIPF